MRLPKRDPPPHSVSTSCQVSQSHSLTASRPLLPATNRRLSGEKATECDPSRKPLSVFNSLSVSTLQIRTVPDESAAAAICPSGEPAHSFNSKPPLNTLGASLSLATLNRWKAPSAITT